MKQGALIYDEESGRYDIRFGLDGNNGGLHCGECFDVFAGGLDYSLKKVKGGEPPRYLMFIKNFNCHAGQLIGRKKKRMKEEDSYLSPSSCVP